MSEIKNILVSGGGTGGHIFPAVAIANGLKARLGNPNILFRGCGGPDGKWRKFPRQDIPIEGLKHQWFPAQFRP